MAKIVAEIRAAIGYKHGWVRELAWSARLREGEVLKGRSEATFQYYLAGFAKSTRKPLPGLDIATEARRKP